MVTLPKVHKANCDDVKESDFVSTRDFYTVLMISGGMQTYQSRAHVPESGSVCEIVYPGIGWRSLSATRPSAKCNVSAFGRRVPEELQRKRRAATTFPIGECSRDCAGAHESSPEAGLRSMVRTSYQAIKHWTLLRVRWGCLQSSIAAQRVICSTSTRGASSITVSTACCSARWSCALVSLGPQQKCMQAVNAFCCCAGRAGMQVHALTQMLLRQRGRAHGSRSRVCCRIHVDPRPAIIPAAAASTSPRSDLLPLASSAARQDLLRNTAAAERHQGLKWGAATRVIQRDGAHAEHHYEVVP